MAQLTVTALAAGSSTPTAIASLLAASSSNGDKFLNTGKEVLLFQNSSSQGAGSSITVTVAAQQIDNYGAAASTHNLAVPVPSSSFGLTAVGPFRPSLYNDTNGFLNVTYSAAGLNVAAVSLAPQS